MRLRILVAATVLLANPARAQVAVSVASGTLAHNCFVSALATVKTGTRLVRDGMDNCNAALEGPMASVDRAATYDNRGILFNVEENYPSAWQDFNTSIKFNPKLGDAYVNRGVALIRMQKVGQAKEDIQNGIALGVSLPEIGYYDLGVADQLLGRIPEAYADFKQALVANPDFTQAAEALKNFKVVTVPPQNG